MSKQLIEEVVRLKELLRCEQANHRNFRLEVFRDPEFAVIIERRERERQQKHSEDYIRRTLEELELATAELEMLKDENSAW
jgi:hypothetical protein